MSKYELISCYADILKQELPKFDFDNPPVDPIEFAKELAESMVGYNGLGLSANQIGIPYRVFAMASNPVIVCYNPKIIDISEETIYLEEGCLSYPNLFVKVKRPRRIKVRYTEPNGNVVTTEFYDLTARIFQHEMDHLDGINFIQRAARIHYEQAIKAAQKRK